MYCVDGCRWRASASDYGDFPRWPSAARAVLEYYEREAHDELDMVRDEFPGTAAALAAAAEAHLPRALASYTRLSDEDKTWLHDEALGDLSDEVNAAMEALAAAAGRHAGARVALARAKEEPPPARDAEKEMAQLEKAVAEAAKREAAARSHWARTEQMLKLEEAFKLDA